MPNEIESRYVIPDEVLLRRLLRARQLGPFTLHPQGRVKTVDRYLDTKGQALRHQGWACRLRREGEAWLLTLKGPREAAGVIAVRPELEISLPARNEDVTRWPAGALRDQVRALTSGLPLQRLVVLRQTRHRLALHAGERAIGELSLDVVRIAAKGRREQYLMLECELGQDGQPEDLLQLDAILTRDYFLLPEEHSKLQRALEYLELGTAPAAALAPTRPLTVEELCLRYDVDMAHAEHVATLADALYAQLLEGHALLTLSREMLRAAALLHEVGAATSAAKSHTVGRDILLRAQIVGLGQEERRTLAFSAYFSRKRVTAPRLHEALGEAYHADKHLPMLTIAALVRLAAALDGSRTQSSTVQSVTLRGEGAQLVVAGPHAPRDAARAQRRSDLWTLLWGRLAWEAASPPPTPCTPPERVASEGPGLLATDIVPLAASKILAFHLAKMMEQREGLRRRHDAPRAQEEERLADAVHDMRVATRRLRSALRLFGPYLHSAHLAAASEGLRRLAMLLGGVRDMDVAILHGRAFLHGLAQPPQAPAPGFVAAWEAQRQHAMRSLLGYVHSHAYQSLLATLRNLIADTACAPVPEAGALLPTLRPHLYIAWRTVSAYAVVLEEAPIEVWHALRIEVKRLRYALEFLREVLPPTTPALIAALVAAQDHLGDLHDAAVAAQRLQDWLDQAPAEAERATAAAYCEARLAEEETLRETFPAAWQRLLSAEAKRHMAKVLKKGDAA
jgi:CHAD domain-containing protein